MKSNGPRKKKPTEQKDVTPQVAGVLGVGLDATDGHKRLTRGQDFLLAGGSEETHSRMQETMIKVTEKLGDRGKRIRDASPEELRDLIGEASS
ncbi:hypothetical protein [Botrimarina mediterranea]|uniref:Uncharacterized protein n=1 Tax=Botrimarina mediterranea TaxID=2528022 RepID=A0A518KCK7_9BACT|nr:hypothetical protein [Botrimarina mediterranea]QDV75533.1 hypothetical protein Spa11_37510 [Botrimarina mediterranea]QDV80167.1 hypothetical protein K2D_37910 [Planctomycetes bacterium K2D]